MFFGSIDFGMKTLKNPDVNKKNVYKLILKFTFSDMINFAHVMIIGLIGLFLDSAVCDDSRIRILRTIWALNFY